MKQGPGVIDEAEFLSHTDHYDCLMYKYLGMWTLIITLIISCTVVTMETVTDKLFQEAA